jgi:hypothetical protein
VLERNKEDKRRESKRIQTIAKKYVIIAFTTVSPEREQILKRSSSVMKNGRLIMLTCVIVAQRERKNQKKE